MGDDGGVAGGDAHALLKPGRTDRPAGAADMADRAMDVERIGEMRFLDEIEIHVRHHPAHALFLRMATHMMVETDTRGLEYAGDLHIVDVTHRIEILKAGIDAGHEAIGTETPRFGFGHVLLSNKIGMVMP